MTRNLYILLAFIPLLLNACERSVIENPLSDSIQRSQETAVEIKGLNVIEIAGTKTAQAGIGQSVQTQTTPEAIIATATGNGLNFPTPTPIGNQPNSGLTQPALMPTEGLPTSLSQVPATMGPPATSVPAANPGIYEIHEGEFPYCLARRFDVDPGELMTLNGISPNQTYFPPGTEIKIPTSGNKFPSDRSLEVHPTSYTVGYGETLFTIACKFGDVDPVAIAAVNGIELDSDLTAGTVIQIP